LALSRKKGEDLLGFNYDKADYHVPLAYYTNAIFRTHENQIDQTIEIRTKPGTSLSELKQEFIWIDACFTENLRPKQEDNYSINQLSVIAKGFDGLFEFA
jgi:hypothetical protein